MLKKSENEIVCVAQFVAKEGKEEELLHALHSLMEPTHKEEGCIRYELNQAIDNPRAITFVEKFKSKEALDSHGNSPYLKQFRAEIVPSLVEGVTVTRYKEVLP